jgi:glycosyltransferase involved in cell wall biosynthesis
MDLVPVVDAFITLNDAEAKIWNSFKRTYVIPKGIDLENYRPIKQEKKLRGSPAVLYAEHWRAFRHPLHVFVALERVVKKIPNMRFYPMGCPPAERDFWNRLISQNRYNYFTPALTSWEGKLVEWLNRADIVVSPIFPSYGRVSLEALACDKPVVAYKTNPHATYKCEPYDPDDMAEKILQCWEEKPGGQREYAEKCLDVKIMAEEAIKIYRRFT